LLAPVELHVEQLGSHFTQIPEATVYPEKQIVHKTLEVQTEQLEPQALHKETFK